MINEIAKLVKYLAKREIDNIEINYNSLIINYESYYSKFKIKIYFQYSEEYYKITYGSNLYIRNLEKRKTTTKNNNFCNNVFKTIIYIRSEMIKEAEKYKNEIDMKTKYCGELEIHYKNIHDFAKVSNINYDNGTVHFTVNASDKNNNIWYDIEFNNNRYLLKQKNEALNLKINIEKYKNC